MVFDEFFSVELSNRVRCALIGLESVDEAWHAGPLENLANCSGRDPV